MAEINPQESNQPGDAGELPTPSFSGEGDSSTSGGADEIVSKIRSALLEDLKPVIQQTIEKQVQSTKDKRIANIEKTMGRLGLLAEIEEAGVEIPKDVRNEMRFRELEAQLASRPTQPAQGVDAGPSTQKQAVADAIAELNKYDLDPNDAEFIGLLRGQYRNRAEFDLTIQRHIVKKIAPSKTPSAADVVQAPATGGVQPKSAQALTSEFAQRMRAAPRGKAGDAVRRALKDEYTQKGVDVHGIDFT